jgi:predicted ATPase
LRKSLHDKHVLVILDNCEHLIESAGDLVSALMQAEKNVTVLATSRERLRISGEAVYRLAPLPLETAATWFADRVATADSDFAISGQRAGIVVADICRKLDGIPLALELAASRVGTLGVHSQYLCFAPWPHRSRGSPRAPATTIQLLTQLG